MKNPDRRPNTDPDRKSESGIKGKEKLERIRAAIKFPFGIARRITKSLSDPIYLCGGAVRNFLMGRYAETDFDFMGDFDIEQIANDYPESVVGRWNELSTIRLKIGSDIYDFISTPDVGHTLSENDITVSNLCLTEGGEVMDFIGGLESLNKKEIRINDAGRKIQADPSRILRVIRFAEQFDYTIEEETLNACIQYASLLETSQFQWEMEEITNLEYPLRKRVFDKLKQYKILDEVFLHDFDQDERSPKTKRVEEEIGKLTSVQKLATIFPEMLLFVGGGVRDISSGVKMLKI